MTHSIKELAEKLNISVQTLRNWDKSGKLIANRGPSGRMFYAHNKFLEIIGEGECKKSGNDIDEIANKVVLITGGTGSLGNAITSRICDVAKKVIIYSRCELKQANMRSKFAEKKTLRYMIGDVRDKNRLSFALSGVDIVIHTAALKRVEANTYNPTEGVDTNIGGTINVAEQCIKANVKRALFISSDKAANPIIPYGYMKALGESCWINFNNYSGGITSFIATRYGNVINSNGSFYHTIQQQKQNGEILITNPNMTRFYMTLDDAVDLNLFALNNSVSGEIFIPKIKSASIMDFIDAFGDGIPTKIIGARGVEKIAECLITEDEMRSTYDCGKYFKIVPSHINDPNMGWDRYRISDNSIVPFKYTSDSKDVGRLDKNELRGMILNG